MKSVAPSVKVKGEPFCLSLSLARGAGAVAPPAASVRPHGLGLLGRLRVSVELVVALVALISWGVVGVVMFDFVEHQAVPGESHSPF